MIADLKPYPAMKDSGVPWLGDVPEHWEVRRAKFLMREVDERSTTGEEELMSVSHKTGVTSRRQKSVTMFLAESNVGHKVCRPGDVVVNTMWAWMAALGVSKQTGIVSPSYGVYRLRRPDQFLQSFLDELLRIPMYRSEYVIRSTGITGSRLRLYPDAFLRIPMLRPEIAEQSGIIRFLDHADRRIRRYIRAKQKLIALLEEQKQAIIHRAVTRGLPSTGSGQADPNVRLKPSGVEWLGDVPEHWEVMLNQRVFKEEIRPHGGQTETQLSLSQRDGLIATSAMQERSLQTSTYDNWKVTIPGDLVLNRFKAHLGVFFSSTLRGIVSFHYGVFAPRRPLVTKYFELLYHTNPYKTIYAGRSNGMTVGLQNLSNQNFYNVRSVVPPVQEQTEIVSFAEKATERLNNAMDAASREVALLREYRARLIADVVTGKLDVREAAARLPEEEEEPEPLVDAEVLAESDEDGEGADLDTAPEEAEA